MESVGRYINMIREGNSVSRCGVLFGARRKAGEICIFVSYWGALGASLATTALSFILRF